MQNVMRVFSVVLLVMVGTVLICSRTCRSYCDIVWKQRCKRTGANKELWLWIILAYYFIATFISINKIIGKIYPVLVSV